jgi:hypothetical protein
VSLLFSLYLAHFPFFLFNSFSYTFLSVPSPILGPQVDLRGALACALTQFLLPQCVASPVWLERLIWKVALPRPVHPHEPTWCINALTLSDFKLSRCCRVLCQTQEHLGISHCLRLIRNFMRGGFQSRTYSSLIHNLFHSLIADLAEKHK